MKMKRMLRKSLAVLMAVSMLIQLGGISNAIGNEGYTEIIVDCGINCEKAQLIANLINGKTSEFQGIAPANILCLFGHSWAQGTATEINHRFRTTAPRCRETIHRVDYCTRSGCNRMDLTQISQVFIHCCS
jgi:hypothetical protein